jgi:hypothetical protein
VFCCWQAQDQANRRMQALELLHAPRDHELVCRRETYTLGEAEEYIFKHDVLLDLRRLYHSLPPTG